MGRIKTKGGLPRHGSSLEGAYRGNSEPVLGLFMDLPKGVK